MFIYDLFFIVVVFVVIKHVLSVTDA